jgi:hypothetical protein
VSTPLIAPRLRTFNFSCVLTDLIVAGKDRKADRKIRGGKKRYPEGYSSRLRW